MNKANHDKSISELKNERRYLISGLVASSLSILGLVFKLITQSEILTVQTPGMPNNATIQRTSMDKASQFAILNAVTSNLVQINPSNADYQKNFLKSFLAPQVYTKMSLEIDKKVDALVKQRELGSYYFVLKQGTSYDAAIDKFFVIGEVHTVNAAKDTAQTYVFEYITHVENYRLWVDSITTYEGDRPHNAEWLKANPTKAGDAP